MDIYIGNQTAFFTRDPEEPFRFALEQGFDAFEWFDDKKLPAGPEGAATGWTFADMSAERRAQMRALAAAGRMRFSVHAEWRANPLEAGGAEHVRAAIGFAREIGATLVNLHLYPEKGPQAFAEALGPLLVEAAAAGLLLTLENTPETSPEDFNRVFALLRAHPDFAALGMCLDIGHANCCAATRNDFIRFIDTLTAEVTIAHCHVHENWGDADTHLTLFTGPAKNNDGGVRLFLDRLRQRNFCGILVLEQYPVPPQPLVDAEKRLRELSGVPRHLPQQTAVGMAQASGGGACPAQPADSPVAAALRTLPAPIVLQRGSEASAPDTGSGNDWNARDLAADLEAAFRPELAGSDFGAALVAAARENTSWRTRLQWVLDRLLDPDFVADHANLAYIAVFLRFLGSGELPCREDGGHYRPCHHARAAEEIENALLGLRDEENAWLLRRIYPWLPAYGQEFVRHEPLTRIRDIAHRNDIPRELKLFIKHNLQNKLHRSAGPEDLQTARAILQRITAHGADFSPAFVEQFRLFYEELQAFFNAPELNRRLTDLAARVPALAAPVEGFQNVAGGCDPLRKTEAALRLRQALHALFADPTVAGAAATASSADRQAARIADIELEDFAFAALAELAGSLEKGPVILPAWFSGAQNAARHLALSGVDPAECAAVAAELQAWSGGFDLADRFAALRLKATLERALRVCDAYSAGVAAALAPAVSGLGAAFRIDARKIAVFIEGDIRANVIFQLSRLVSFALGRIRAAQNLPPWAAVVPGEYAGRLLFAQSLDELGGQSGKEGAYLVALSHATGEEEIPPAVRAILLAHPLPHLSHLAVRARQSGTGLAAADDPEAFAGLRPLCGTAATVVIDPRGVTARAAEAGAPAQPAARQPEPARLAAGAAECGALPPVVPIDQATVATCGAKAVGAHSLIGLALASNGLFSAPRALAIPFATLHGALENAPAVAAEYRALSASVDALCGGEYDNALRRLRQLVSSLPVPEEIRRAVVEFFGEETRIAVRSSSNGEDLAGLAGAGLYDSIVGVRAGEVVPAVSAVWASLWTKRAAQSRKFCGISHEAIRMAVLVQELAQPEYSFVLHTADPLSGERGAVGIEIAAGLGETLASAEQPGQPWRLLARPGADGPLLEACASFTYALQPSDELGVFRQRIDYSRERLSADKGELFSLAGRLAEAGRFLDGALNGAQDIEGVARGREIFLVQTRPQAGLPGA